MQSLLPSLRVLAEATGDSVTIHVQNHGVDPVQVSTRATLMRVTEGAAVSVGTYVLRDSCAREPQACVTLAPGAELIPPAWPGRKGHDQCAACAACDVITRGRYLVELKSCDGKNSAQASFELSAAP